MKKIISYSAMCLVLLGGSSAGYAVLPPAEILAQQPGQAAGIILKMRRIEVPVELANTGGHAPLSAQAVEELKVVAAADLTYKRTASLGTHVLNFAAPKTLAEAQSIAERLSLMADVEYAEPNRIYRPLLVPNDALYSSQWGLNGVVAGANLPAAWDITTGSSAVVVAVLDTGYTNHLDLNYTDFATDGYDFISSASISGDGDGRDSDARDEGDFCTAEMTNSSWHGTAVASVIRANTNTTGALMAGVAWSARILPVRVLGTCGGTTDDIVDAIRWSAGLTVTGVPVNPNPAKVINLSLGGIGLCSATEQAAANEAHAAGAVIIAAAGNEAIPAKFSAPANCTHIMSIAAHDDEGDIASFSNYGEDIDLSAPGVAIHVAACSNLAGYTAACVDDNTIEIFNGTSFSAPMVAGVAALMFARDPLMNNYYVEQVLRQSARAFPAGSSCAGICGFGMLDAATAVSMVTNFTPAAQQVEITRDGGGFSHIGFWLGLLLLSLFARKAYQRRTQ